MPSGKALIRDIDDFTPAPGEFALWWLGQHGFVLKLGVHVIYIDAFLSDMDSRQVPPLLKPAEVANADLILGTHDHGDHIDRDAWPAMAAASPQARFVVPELLRRKVAEELKLPPERVVGVDDMQTVEVQGSAEVRSSASHSAEVRSTTSHVPGVRITGVAAAHEFLDRDVATGQYPYLGYVVEAGGATIYHSGDCCTYEGLQTKLKRWTFDLVLLPINGRDAVRLAAGCIGNMTYQEAADLAGALEPRRTIPAHYDMFAVNAADPKLFVDYMRVKYPRLQTSVCEHGVRVVLPAGGGVRS
jgi:L-ascorbate metabolism protein UlaG (beta-lactamase superfamily)